MDVARARQRLTVCPVDWRTLQAWVRAGTTPQRVVRRARIVLLAAEGIPARAIARHLQISARTVTLWSDRYRSEGTATLWRDAPGRGRRPTIDAASIGHLKALFATTPPEGGRWTVRRLAAATGLSRASVHRIVRTANCETLPGRPGGSSPASRRTRWARVGAHTDTLDT